MNNQNKIDLNHNRFYEVIFLLLIAVLVFLIYSNTLNGSFIFDDEPNIELNNHIRLTDFSLQGLTRAGFKSPSFNRPIANISFALNYYFHRYHVFGFHLVNVLIHITTGILLYFFLKTTLCILQDGRIINVQQATHPRGVGLCLDEQGAISQSLIPLFAALIWLVHPVQSQSVTYIVQRMNSMAVMFYILSFLLYVKARINEKRELKWTLFVGAFVSGLLALGTKEIAAILLFFIFLYEWYFFRDLSWSWLKRHFLPFALILVIITIIAIIYLGSHPLQKILSTYDTRDFTLTQRVLTEFRVVVFYISLLFFPHPARLNLDHDFTLSHSLTDPFTTLLSLVFIIGLMLFAVCSAKKERLISFGILWFLGNLVIESSVIGLEIIFEHRTYLPSMFFCLIIVCFAYRYIRSNRLLVGILCCIVIICSFWTYKRNSIWNDDITLWQDCVKKSPNKARPHHNLGKTLYDMGIHQEATDHFYKAIKLKPDYPEAHYSLGIVLEHQRDIKRAIEHYSEALRIKPDYAEAHYNIGVLFGITGNYKQELHSYKEAIKYKPDYAKAYSNLGAVCAQMGLYDEAAQAFNKAVRMNPDDRTAEENLKRLYMIKRKGVKAAMQNQ